MKTIDAAQYAGLVLAAVFAWANFAIVQSPPGTPIGEAIGRITAITPALVARPLSQAGLFFLGVLMLAIILIFVKVAIVIRAHSQ